MRILIADDDFLSLAVLSAVLKKQGHEVVEATDGAAAWEAMQEPGAPALAILDWMMPEIDGPEVVRRIRALQTGVPPYLIMLTNRAAKSDIVAGLKAGANDYLPKPFDHSELLARVEVGRRTVEMQAAVAALNETQRRHQAELQEQNEALLQMQEELSRREEKYRILVETTNTGFLILDRGGTVTDANAEYVRLAGRREIGDILGKSVFEWTASYEKERKAEAIAQCLERGFIRDFTVDYVAENGLITPVEISASVAGAGEAARIILLCRDITKRKRTEAERERLALAIQQVGEIVIITNANGVIQYVNPAFETSTGYSREEAVGQTPRILKSGHQDVSFYRAMWKTISSGKMWQGTLVNKKKDGTHFTESTTISPVIGASGKIVNYVAVKRDITSELRMKAQFDQSQKMESVGRLAGGVAHDFNNMLGVILGHTELAMEQVSPDSPVFSDLQEIRKAADHSADLTQQLLAFSRQQTIMPKVVNLSETISGMLKMLGRLIGEDIKIAFLPAKELWPVKLDPTQLDQVLINLCVNARDAIFDVGTITIETSNNTFDEDYCAGRAGFLAGEYVGLSVSDSGCGMDNETKSHVFEPFFTTKDQGKGTGLGLATVYGIVRQNSGFIHIASEPGEGTRMSIYLPRNLCGDGPEQSNEAGGSHSRGHETILVVEDEPAILSMTKALLQRQGYFVLAANSPAEALLMAHEHHSKIHMLMTDVIMPEMNGRELAKSLQARFPHLQLLFMSGYTASVIAHHGVLDPGVCFIQKPFSMRDLAATVRNALDRECPPILP
ncbi:MAG: response regulator [Verrucomicrobiae bacterium]